MSHDTPDGGGGSSDVYIDASAMAGDADTLGRAASTITTARDGLNTTWKNGSAAFGSTEVLGAFNACCEIWVAGTNTIGQLTQFVAQYTQDVANAYGASDTQLAASATAMYDKSTLPKPGVHYRAPQQTGPVA